MLSRFNEVLGNKKIEEIIQGHGLEPEAREILKEFLKELKEHPMQFTREAMFIFGKIKASPQKQKIIMALLEINSEYGMKLRSEY